MSDVRLKIIGLDCPDCAGKLEGKIAGLKGVLKADLDFASATVRVAHDETITDTESLIKSISGFGYKSVPEDEYHAPQAKFDSAHREILIRKIFLLVSLAAAAGVLLSVVLPLSIAYRVVFALLAVMAGGWFVFKAAFFALINRSADINLLMSIAVIGAMLIGEWSEAAVTMVLFALANYLEGRSVRKAQRAFRSLAEQIPQEIEREAEGTISTVRLDQLHPGDIIRLRPGMTCPTDCRIIEGKAFINQAAVTGEAMPVSLGPGAQLLGGSINTDGFLRLRVLRHFSDSTLSKIMQMVEASASKKAPLAALVDRFARVYTPVVVGLSLFAALLPPLVLGGDFQTWFYRALVFLVISCPCALVISTPVAMICALTRAARDGILFKGGSALEKLAGIKAVLFDKTGTLTKADFEVTDITVADTHRENEVVSLAAAVEQNSEHPIARAIVRYALAHEIAFGKTERFQAIPGEGARAGYGEAEFLIGSHRLFHEKNICQKQIHDRVAELERQGKSVVLLAENEKLIGALALEDQPKPESAQAIGDLRRQGLEQIIMITGDNRPTAEAMAGRLGISEVKSELLPEEKSHTVEDYRAKFGSVAMVGDGLNDAPALAAAEVGIAMGTGGTDVAIEAAEIAIIGDNPAQVPRAISLARRTLKIIKFNIIFAIVTKFIFMALAWLGWATLWMAVMADMGVSLLVIANALRLLRR